MIKCAAFFPSILDDLRRVTDTLLLLLRIGCDAEICRVLRFARGIMGYEAVIDTLLLLLRIGCDAEICRVLRFARGIMGYEAVILAKLSRFERIGIFDFAIGGLFASSINLLTSRVQSIGMRTRFDLLIITACSVAGSDVAEVSSALLRIYLSSRETLLSISESYGETSLAFISSVCSMISRLFCCCLFTIW